MRRSLLVLIISGISTGAVASGYALWSYVSADRVETAAATAVGAVKSTSAGQSTVAALTPPPQATPPGVSALLAIEVARIEAGGPSVLAGRSPPNHKVTILANGREIARVTATDEGQWAAVVPEGIAAGPLELSIVSEPKEGGAPVRGAARQLVVPPGPALASATPVPARPQAQPASAENRPPASVASPRPVERPQAQARLAEGEDAASKRALAEFEALVARTRKEMAGQETPRAAAAASSGGAAVPVAEGPKPAPSAAPLVGAAPASSAAQVPAASVRAVESAAASSVPATSETKVAAAMPSATRPSVPAAATPAAVQAPIPLPITFASNRAVLTPNGEKAASLLAEYLRLKQPAGITLSGHADARGPDSYNMRLSLRRLEAIQRYLRAAGYSGQLSLVPRGKRDPYQGIDRRRLPLREIQQADRRVELQLTP